MGKGRYTALAQPLAAPGQCFFSGEAGAEKGPYIDTGRHVTKDRPFYGRVYLSKHTVTEMYTELQKFEDANPDEETALTKLQAENALQEKFDAGFLAGWEACRAEIKGTFNAVVDSFGDSASSSASDDLISLLEDRPIDDAGADKGKSGATGTPIGLDADPGSKESRGVPGNSSDAAELFL